MSAKEGSLPTATDGHSTFDFDGIFRDVNNPETRKRLYAAQKLITDGKWEESKTKFKELINDTTDKHDKRNIELILKEVETYEERHISDDVKASEGIDWDVISQRPPKIYFEKWDELPQSVFLLKSWQQHNGMLRALVGRRILSHQWIASKIRELHCSHIRASMILGLMFDQRVQDDGFVVYYKELTPGEKKFIMHDIVQNRIKHMEIIFPYPVLQTAYKEEIHCPDEGWEIDETLALQLGEGEVFLREYSVQFLKSLGKEDLTLYDPACSTGQFLWTMKQALPKCHTVGQDISQHMVSFAKKRVDEIYCGNAIDPKQIFICGNNKVIKQMNSAGKFVEKTSTDTGNQPFDLTLTGDAQLIFSDHNGKCINLVKNNGRIESLIKLQKWFPMAICSTSVDDLLVTMESQDLATCKVVRYSGSTVKQEIQFDVRGEQLYCRADFIDESKNLDVVVSDLGARRIVVVDKYGIFRFNYTGNLQSERYKSFGCSGVTTDTKSNIIVADEYNDVLHVIDQNGQFLMYIDNCKLQRPGDLCTDSDDVLYVTEPVANKVKKIKFYK